MPPEAAERFVVHLAATGIAHAETVDGFRGALVLRRVEDDQVRFVLVTFWRDEEAVRPFAGPTPTSRCAVWEMNTWHSTQ